jgi:hypothetical protein
MMVRCAVAVILCNLACVVHASDDTAKPRGDRDAEGLERAAVSTAVSGDPTRLAVLARLLGERSYLARLDPMHDSEIPVVRLARVFRALAEHPSQATASLCVSLGRSPDFTAAPARLNLLLNALAAVRPMSQESADLFRSTNVSGFFEVNAPLLAKNASPRALEILSEMLSDQGVDLMQRVSIAHWALLPTRTDVRVVTMSSGILEKQTLPHEVRIAILESLYDYQPRRWFGLDAAQPAAPSWETSSRATRTALRLLGKAMLRREDLPDELRTAIQKTLDGLPLKAGAS